MTIMTVSDFLTGDMCNWDPDTQTLLEAVGDWVPDDDQRIRDAVLALEEDARDGNEESARCIAAAIGLHVQERRLAIVWWCPTDTLLVTLKEWSEIEGDWTYPVDGRLAAPTETLLPDDDWQDDAPYTAAEDRLLAAVGLTRDDISETIPCW